MSTLRCCVHPDSEEPAIILAGKNQVTITHSTFASNVTEIGQNLRSAGIADGKRVAIVLSNSHLFAATFLATTLQSCIAGPLNHNLKQPEFEFYYEDFKADLVILSEEDVSKQVAAYQAAQALNIPIARASASGENVTIKIPQNLGWKSTEEINLESKTQALVLHTSGTTGKPKAVPLTHGNLTASITNIQEHYQFTAKDRTSIIMPLFHIHGIVCALLTPLAAGSAIILSSPVSGITPSFLRDAVTYKATWYTATPTLHRLVLKLPSPQDPLKFRFVRSCSSPLDAVLLEQLEEKFKCVVVEAYAMTEAAHQVCSNPADSGRKGGTVGRPTGVDVRILGDDGSILEDGKVGEVCLKGTNVMSGYIDNDEANQKGFTDGWFRTGDLGKFEDGFLSLTGRIKEMINKGGEKIGPVEIDAVVNKHDCVDEVVTFGIPDDMYGEEVALAVVLKAQKTITEKELKSWIGERLAQAKVPKKVYFVEKIPKTAVGKMQRSLVAKTMLGEQ